MFAAVQLAPSHILHQIDPGWCGTTGSSIVGLLFVTGLVGGFAHCGPMCGPFVLAQTAATPAFRRLTGVLLLPYHLGRATTYAMLGAVVATVGGSVVAAEPLHDGLAVPMLLAGCLFLGQAVVRLAPGARWRQAEALSARCAAGLAYLARRFIADPSPAGRFVLGAILGFLPCGFLYAALAAAAATQNAAAGAAAMGGFALGTVPSLALVGFGGAIVAARWRNMARHLLAPLFLFDGAALTAMAIGLAFGGN
jgi:uncharacterized protein